MENMENEVQCVVCQSKDNATLFDRGRFNEVFTTVVCKKCGFVFISPRATYTKTSEYYLKGGYRRQESIDINKIDVNEKMKKATIGYERAQKQFQEFENYYKDRLESGGKVLDVGANLGHFLSFMKGANWDVLGVDPDEFHSLVAMQHFGIKIEVAMYEQISFPEKHFDVIVLSHILEHCDEPNTTVIKIFKELKDNGLLYLEVPCIERPYNGNLDRFFWKPHLNYFSVNTLSALLANNGFKVIKSGYHTNFLWVFARNPKRINRHQYF